VQKVVDLLGSPEVAIDDRHGPKLYSRFLEGLLATPTAKVDYSPPIIRKPLRRSKSATSQRAAVGTELPAEIPIIFPAESPSTTNNLPLEGTSQAFDGFPSFSADDPFADGSTDLSTLNMDYFQPPLAFDNEILQSMQSLTGWQDVSLPGMLILSKLWRDSNTDLSSGFNWMSQLQGTNDNHLQYEYDTAMLNFPSP
jgi:hypothetical protein